jgi:hypothetical protein
MDFFSPSNYILYTQCGLCPEDEHCADCAAKREAQEEQVRMEWDAALQAARMVAANPDPEARKAHEAHVRQTARMAAAGARETRETRMERDAWYAQVDFDGGR